MNRSGSKEGDSGGRKRDEVVREEQGDLLADAVTGAFSGGLFSGTDDQPGEDEPKVRDAEAPSSGKGPVEKSAPPDGTGPRRESNDSAVDGHEAVGRSGLDPADPPPDPRPDPPDAIPDSPWERKMAWAKERAVAGRHEEAEGLYRELLDEDPVSVRALNNLGILLDEMGDAAGAATHLAAAHKLDPQNQEIMGNLGAALGALGRYVEAEEILRKAVRLDPSNLEARANLGILLHRRGLYDEAEVELGVVCLGSPENGTAFFYRGEALNRLGRVDEAIEALERVIELLPGNQRAHYALGVLFDKKDLPEKAAAMYRRARELTKP